MKTPSTSIMVAVFLSPAIVCAQAGDAAYCKALSEKYGTYLANMSIRRDLSVLAQTVLGIFSRKDAIGDAADRTAKPLKRDLK